MPRKLATCSALTASTAWRESCSRKQGLERLLGAKHQVGGVLDLHQTPVIALSKQLAHRAQAGGVAVQPPMQFFGAEAIGQRLRARAIAHLNEGIVGERELDARSHQLACKPIVAVTVELQAKRTPGGHAQITPMRRLRLATSSCGRTRTRRPAPTSSPGSYSPTRAHRMRIWSASSACIRPSLCPTPAGPSSSPRSSQWPKASIGS